MKALDLIFFGRPLLVIPVWTVYLHYLAIESGAGYFNFRPGANSIINLLILTLIFMGSYVINQIFDIDSDRINNKLYFLPRGIISIATAWAWYGVVTVGGLIIAIVMSPQSIRAAIVIIALGVLYSVPGVRLKDNPIGGLMANAVGYGIMVPWTAADEIMTLFPGIGMIPYFLAIASGYILTTIPDLSGDSATGKRTLAVIMGVRGALWLALLTTLATVGASVWLGNYEMGIVAGATAVGVGYILMSSKAELIAVLCKVPILLLTLIAASHYLFYMAVLLLTIILTRVYYKKRFGIVYPELN